MTNLSKISAKRRLICANDMEAVQHFDVELITVDLILIIIDPSYELKQLSKNWGIIGVFEKTILLRLSQSNKRE